MAKSNIKSLLSGSGSSGSLLPKPKAAEGNTLDDLMRQNQKSKARIEASGEKDPTGKKGPSALEHIFGPLDTLGTGVRGLVHNAVAEEDVNVLGEMGKALKGERRVEGADILGHLGVDNKWGKFLGGVALDVALDPLTYISWGYSAAAKSAGKTAITTAAKSGGLALDDVARFIGKNADEIAEPFAKVLASEGDDIAEVAAKLLSGQMKVPLGNLDNVMARAVKHGLMAETAAALGDKGGLKVLGATVAPMQGTLDKASDLARLGLKTKPGEWVSKALLPYGDKIPTDANDLMRIAIPRMEKQAAGIVAKGQAIGAKMRSLIEKNLPDEAMRDTFTIGIGREFGDVAQRQGIDELYKTVRAAREAGDDTALATAENALRETLAKTYDPDAIAKAFVEAGFDQATVDKARQLAPQYHELMDEMAQVRTEAGLPSWVLYGEYLPDNAPRSAGYARGANVRPETNILGLPTKATKQTLDAQDEVAQRLGITMGEENAPLASRNLFESGTDVAPMGTPKVRLNPKAYKSKKFIDDERRMVEGGLLTDLDIGKLSEAKVSADYVDVAAKTLSDNLAQTGMPLEQAAEMAANFRGVFNEDEAIKGFFRTFDRIQNAWKRGATALRIPAFQNRNLLSDKILQAMKGVLDGESEVRAVELMKKIHLGQIAKGSADEKEVYDLIERGVIQTAEQFAEQVGGGKFVSMPAKFGGAVNEIFENQSRVAAFYAGLKKGLDPESAARLVDETLYDYSNVARTAFDRSVMMRAVPFWKWTRQNVPNMVTVLAKDPGKMTWLGHLKESGEAISERDRSVEPDWLRDLFPIPTPLQDARGNEVMISTAGLFPQGDLEIVSGLLRGKFDPKDAFSSLSPILRTPMELLFNKDLFYDTPITKYPGEKKRVPAFVEKAADLMDGVPGLGDVWGFVANRLGIEERDIEGASYWVAPAEGVKILRDLTPWLNNVSKMLESQPKTPYDRFAGVTGVKPILYEQDRFAQQQQFEDRSQLQDVIQRLRDENRLAEPQKSTQLADLFGGR